MTIIQQPDALSLSYNIRDFRISSTASVSFVLKKGDVSIVAQTYEPGQDGYVTIKVRDIIHAQLAFVLQTVGTMYEQPDIVADFTAVIDSTEVTFRAIRSGVENFADTAANFLTANWLTWQPQEKPVTYASPEFLTYYAVIASICKLKACYTNEVGNVTAEETITVGALAEEKAYTIPMQYAAVSTLLGGKLPAFYDVWIEDGSGNRLTYIQRYYAGNMKSEQEDWILFENSLGGIDTFRAYGATNFTGEHTHNIAEIDEISEEYRVDTQRKYQKNTGYLNMRERRWLLDFFPSARKLIYTAGALRSIVVTDSDVTYQDKELPSSYTFTYKYADAKPLLNIDRASAPAEVLNIAIPDLGNFTVPPRLVELASLPLTEGALFPVQSPYDEAWKKTTAGALFQFIANKLTNNYNGGGGIGHTHNNLDLLQLLSYVDEYLEVDGKKIKAGYADDFPDEIEKVKTFLKGLTVNGDKASIDKDGIATVQQLIALVKAQVTDLEVTNAATVKTVTVLDKVTTLNLLVQKLAEMYDLKVSNVATLFRTIIKDYVSSETFIAGLAGEGFKLYKALSGDWNLELDNLTIRKGMTVFELIISKIRAVNGGLVVSQANGRVKSVNEDTTNYILGIEGDMTFVADDLVRCQVFGSYGAKYYWVRASSVSNDSIIIAKSEFPEGTVPAVGDDLVQMGNKTNSARQGILYLTASEDGKPRFSVLDGVNSTDLTGKNKLILGCLDGITDSDFPSDAQPSGYGLWAVNVFLKGLFILRNGKSIEDELNDQITAVRTAFEIREGQISSKVTEATVAATNAGNSAVLAQGYASTAGQKASAAAGSATDAANILTVVTQKETSINQTAQAIELKAVRAESAAGRAESAEASINLKADGIVLQASNQAAKTAIDGMQIGGRNLLRNSSNFANTDYWSGPIIVVEEGKTCLYKEYYGTVETYIIQEFQPLKQNTSYTLSFMCKTSGANQEVYVLGDAIQSVGFLSPNGFTKKVFRFNTGNNNQTLVRFDINGAGSSTKSALWLYDIKLEEGNKATDWTPAPEDVAQDATNKANTAEDNAKQYANSTFTTKTTYDAEIQILSGQISSKVSQTDFNSLGVTVSSHSSTINQLPTTIDQRITTQVADGGIIKTNVESWFTLSGNTISLGAKSFNISGATVFSSLATQTQAQDYAKSAVDGVQVGGRNLLRNSSNFANTDYWSGPIIVVEEGKTCLYKEYYGTVETYIIQEFQPLKQNTSYTLSFMCKTSGANQEVYVLGDAIQSVGFLSPNGFTKKVFRFNTGNNNQTLVRFDINGAGSSTKSALWLYDIKLEEGNKATDWTPAPEDVSQDATDKALAAQSTAISAAATDATAKVTTSQTALATQLGYSSYAALEAQAAAGKTIINGGYINTLLIKAKAITSELIDVANLTVRNVEAKDSNGNVTCKINGATGDVKIKGDLTVQSLRLSLIPDGESLKGGYLMLSSSGSYIAPELSDNEVMEVRFITPAWSRMVVSITLIPKNSNVRIGTTIWLLSAVNSNVTISGIGSILGFKSGGITYWIISYNEKD